MKYLSGIKITNRSFGIIRERLGDYETPEDIMEIIIRIAHAAGDVEFARTFIFHGDPVRKAIDSLMNGANIITDVEMVRTGIRKNIAETFGGKVLCFLNHPEVIKGVKGKETTRSALAIRMALPYIKDGIVAIGNAPTALFELMEMIKEGATEPAVVVGVPVGFVGALESKTILSGCSFPHITNLSERGGSAIAAAIVNGFLTLALMKKKRCR